MGAVLGEHYNGTGKVRWMLADDPRCRQYLLSEGWAERGDRKIRPRDGGQEETRVSSQGLLLTGNQLEHPHELGSWLTASRYSEQSLSVEERVSDLENSERD